MPQRVRKARHFPRSLKLYFGAMCLFLSGMALLGFAWQLGLLIWSGERAHGFWAIGLFAFFLVARLMATVISHQLHCPLCHGTVMHERSCRKHAEAVKLPGLTYRATMVVQALFTFHFSCMYCGTPYRLKK